MINTMIRKLEKLVAKQVTVEAAKAVCIEAYKCIAKCKKLQKIG